METLEDRLVARALWEDPYPLFTRLRREAAVWRLPGENAYLVSTWKLVTEATDRVADFSNHFRYTLFSHEDGTLGALETGAIGPDVFAGEDPPAHTAQRKVFFPHLTPPRIEGLEPYVAAVADELLDDLLAKGRGDAATALAHPLPMRVVAEQVIGFHEPELDQLRHWMFTGSRLTGGLLTLEQMMALSGEVVGMAPWTTAQLESALKQPATGLLAAAADAVRSGALTHEEAAFTLMVLVGAGAETTTSLLGIAIAILAERPELQDELRANPSNIEAFVSEVLRFESPFRFHPRTASRTTELGGVEIPRGALVLLLWSAANRDPEVFEDPDLIKVNRHNAHLHVGFGRGVHHCIGAPLARLEARVVLTKLLERTASFQVDPDWPPRWSDSIWIRRHENLGLVLQPQ